MAKLHFVLKNMYLRDYNKERKGIIIIYFFRYQKSLEVKIGFLKVLK